LLSSAYTHLINSCRFRGELVAYLGFPESLLCSILSLSQLVIMSEIDNITVLFHVINLILESLDLSTKVLIADCRLYQDFISVLIVATFNQPH